MLLIWAGVGGFIAAMAGPLVLGSVWNGVSRAGAISGFWTGAVAFILIHARILSFGWLDGTSMQAFGQWFDFNATSPYSAATMGAIASVVVTTIVSRCSAPVVDGETATTTAEHTQ